MKKLATVALLLFCACRAEPTKVSTSQAAQAAVQTPTAERASERGSEAFDLAPMSATTKPKVAQTVDAEVTENTLPAQPLTGLPPDQTVELSDGTTVDIHFEENDPYTGISQACLSETRKLVPANRPKWRKAVYDWCEHRGYSSSRYGTIESRVDGSWIHDRDRPTAWRFYTRGILKGRLDPDSCPYHAIDETIRHPKREKQLAKACTPKQTNWRALCWNYGSPKMSDRLKKEWFSHPYDMERFGARGPIDWNANAFNHLRGCWDPASLDRYDVSATTTVVASLKICANHGCRTKWDIKSHWGRRAGPPKKKRKQKTDHT